MAKSDWIDGQRVWAADLNQMGSDINAALASAGGFVPKSLRDFGAVADGTYNSSTHAMTGTDNTVFINAALATGKPVVIPPGLFYYTGQLHTNVAGSGLVGSGSHISFLMTDQDIDFHIVVVQATQNTTWIGFTMLGPFTTSAPSLVYNRALLIGSNDARTDVADDYWDASGTYIDDFVTNGYCVGLHVGLAHNVNFGTIEVYEAGDSRADPGSYGITCSGSNLYGRLLRCANTTTRARHALYYNGAANDGFVERVEAKGFDLAAVQQRCTAGGGQRNGFGFGRFEDCTTNSVVEPTTIKGVVHFGTAADVVITGAGGARIGDYVTINCGGFPGPSLRYMPDSRCGTVQAFGHSGDFATDHYGAHIFNSANVELPLLICVSGFDAAGLNDATFKPLVVETSTGCYGGGVRMHSGALFDAGYAPLDTDATVGTKASQTNPVLNGTPTGTGVDSGFGVGTLAIRDSSGNIAADVFIPNLTSTVTSGGTLVMAIGSRQVQVLTGTSGHTITLPTTSIAAGHWHRIINNSSVAVTVNSSGGNLVTTVAPGTQSDITAVQATPTTAAHWAAGSPSGSGGDASTNTATSVDSEVALFSGTGGKTLKRATGSGLAKLTSGALGTATAGTDYVAPGGVAGSLSLTTPVLDGTPTGTGVDPGFGTGTLALRDSSGNIATDVFIPNLLSTATAAGTSVLTVGSRQFQVYTGATTQTVTLPTTSILAGHWFRIINNSSGAVTVNSSAGNLVKTVSAGTQSDITACQATPTAGTHWAAS